MDVIEAVERLLTNPAQLLREDEEGFWLANDAMMQAHSGPIEQTEVVCGRYLWKSRYDIHSMYRFSRSLGGE